MHIVKCSQMDSKVTDKMPNNILDYEDIQLIPQKCVLEHRHQAQTSVQLGSYTFQIPVVPANMASVIDEKLAVWLAQNNYFLCIVLRPKPASILYKRCTSSNSMPPLALVSQKPTMNLLIS